MIEEQSLRNLIDTSVSIQDNRTLSDVLLSAGEELGELSTEIQIQNGRKNRKPSPDGVVGEAVDLALCALDAAILQLNNLGKDTEEILCILTDTIDSKSNKWYSNYSNKDVINNSWRI